MQDTEILGILNVRSSAIEPRGYAREINEQMIQNKFRTNPNSNVYPIENNKDKYKIDYILSDWKGMQI